VNANFAMPESLPAMTPLDDLDVDPELLALPAPPRARAAATAGLMVGVIALSGLLMWGFRGDLQYFLSGATAPVDLGEAVNLDRVPENEYVTVRGLPKAASAVRFRRIVKGGTYRVYPVMEQPALFVQSFVEDGTRVGRRPRHGEYTGRIVSFSEARGGYDAIAAFLRRDMSVEVPENAWILMAGESPRDYAWVVVLYVLLLAFIVTNGILLYRHVRPVPIDY